MYSPTSRQPAVALAGFVMASPQQQRLLCDHLFIIPELDPIQAGLLEQAVANAKRGSDDFERVTAERDGARSCAEDDLARVGMVDLDPPVGRSAALGQLEEDANLAMHQGKRRLFQRAD